MEQMRLWDFVTVVGSEFKTILDLVLLNGDEQTKSDNSKVIVAGIIVGVIVAGVVAWKLAGQQGQTPPNLETDIPRTVVPVDSSIVKPEPLPPGPFDFWWSKH